MPDKNFHPNQIAQALQIARFSFVREYKFHPVRKFRFDFAIPAYKIAIEFEGGVFQQNTGHNSIAGYTKDCEKYRLAVIEGWRVLRYTANDFRGKNSHLKVIDDINQILKPTKINIGV